MFYGTNILERSGMDTELAMVVNVAIGVGCVIRHFSPIHWVHVKSYLDDMICPIFYLSKSYLNVISSTLINPIIS